MLLPYGLDLALGVAWASSTWVENRGGAALAVVRKRKKAQNPKEQPTSFFNTVALLAV